MMTVKPFLKWAGGKKRLLPKLLNFIPKKYNSYFEPFLGSGTLYFALKPKEAYLSDINEELINTFNQIKTNVELVLDYLEGMEYKKKYYYDLRAKKIFDKSLQAARFIYLNKTCWNGLYRVNSKGEFNVPMGKYKNPTIFESESLIRVSKQLKTAEIFIADFEEAVKEATKNDFIYFDPPYTTSKKNNGFIKYNSKLFSLEDQFRLEKIMTELDRRGCKIVTSNADHPTIRECFRKFNINVIQRKSLIASKIKNRRTVNELIITNF
jgi:DNA adenine methylase